MLFKETKDASTRSVLRTEAKHASIYTISSLITQMGSFLLLPLFWKKLSPADYGIIGVSEILCSILGIFWGLSLEVSISRFYYEWQERDRKKNLGSLWMTAWGSAVVLGALSIFLLSFLNRFIFPDVQFYPYILLGLTHGIMGRMRIITFFTIRIKQLPWLYFGYSLAIFTLSIVTNIVFVFFLNWGLFGYFVAWNISELVLLIACTFLMLRFATPCIHKDGLREAVLFALPLIPNSIISALSSVSDRYILQRFVSIEALGIYSLCIKFTNIIILISDAIKMSYVPFICKAVSEEGNASAKKIGLMRTYYLLPIFTAGLGIAFFIGPLVHILNRVAYFPVADYVPLLIGTSIVATFFPYYASGFFLAKRSDMILVPTIVQLIFVLGGGIALIPVFQLYGIVISRFITSIAFVAVGIALSQKLFPIPIDIKKISIMLLLMAAGIVIARMDLFTSLYMTAGTNVLFFISLSILMAITIINPLTLRKELHRLLCRRFPFFSKL